MKRNKLREVGKFFSETARALYVGAILSVPLIIGSAAMIGTAKLGQYGLEKATQGFVEERHHNVTFQRRKDSLLLGTHGRLFYGEFELEDGSEVKFYDGAYLSEGKIWENSRIPKLEEGRKYRVRVVGNDTLGWTLLETNER